jgi:hypothetical protein
MRLAFQWSLEANHKFGRPDEAGPFVRFIWFVSEALLKGPKSVQVVHLDGLPRRLRQ